MTSQIDFDRTGFPLIWIDAIEAYVHWLPVTKIQFEYFICDIVDSRFDSHWYEQILARNPRISPQEIRPDNYWQALLTGITPVEAESFALWCGENYNIPKFDEWIKVYNTIKNTSPVLLPIFTRADMKPRVRILLEQLDAIVHTSQKSELTLAHQMLMREGVMEWVRYDKSPINWDATGCPNRKFHSDMYNPDSGRPRGLSTLQRQSYLGFRLIRRDR